jgi:Xaa-Pro aminopeptidase
MQHARPGMQEFMLEAFMEFGAKKRGSRGLAYVPVIAGGPRALIIHYVSNNNMLMDGQLVLMDAGAVCDGFVIIQHSPL